MSEKIKYFSLLVLLSFLFSTQQASVNAISQQTLNIIDNQEFFAFGPSETKLDEVLVDNYPDWASFEQTVSWYPEPVKMGKIIETASFQEQYSFNPAVTLVTLGESLNWQIPTDGDLNSQALQTSEDLIHSALDWINPENEQLRAQYPQIANGATYALYIFFGQDESKLQTWQNTYQQLFGGYPSSFSLNAISELSTTIEPFIEKPFLDPDTSFIPVNAFFDHHYPKYSEEGDGGEKDFVVRFDGVRAQKSTGPPEVDVTVDHCKPSNSAACYSGHDGIDYGADLNWQVRASASGTVVRVVEGTNTVYILHENGLMTYYMHMNEVFVKSQDDDPSLSVVETGDIIGKVGAKGTGGVHLHFGVQRPDNFFMDFDPYGWWSLDPDPWSAYPTYGQTSTWLWKGDEVGDGYLTVDNRESQAQLFMPYSDPEPAFPTIGWHRLTSGYDGEAWYSFMHNATDDLHKYWAIWGSTIEQPGEYIVQAYWPSDPDSSDEWQPSSNARYTLYYHQNGALQKTFLYGNQTVGANQFNPLCKVELAGGNCPAD